MLSSAPDEAPAAESARAVSADARRRAAPLRRLGVNLTTAWEKSGALDGTRVTPGIGPAVQLGLDIDLSSSVLLNLDARWNLYRPNLEIPAST